MKPKPSTLLIPLMLLFVLGIFNSCEMFKPNELPSKSPNSYFSTDLYSDNPYFQYLFGRLNSEMDKANVVAQMDSLYTVGNIRLHQLNAQLLQQQNGASHKALLDYSLKIYNLKDSLSAIQWCRGMHQIKVLEAHNMQSNKRLEQTKIWCYCLAVLLLFIIGAIAFFLFQNRFQTSQNTQIIPISTHDINNNSIDEITVSEEVLLAPDEDHSRSNGQYITLTNREKTRLKLVDILYVQADSGGVNYHTTHGVYFNWQSLKSCLHLLPEPSFVQISKTVVVASPAIIGKTKSMVRMINNAELSIGRAFQDKISDK